MSNLLHNIVYRIKSSRSFNAVAGLFNNFISFFPTGHFHSPIPSLKEIESNIVFNGYKDIDFDELEQLNFLKDISGNYYHLPFQDHKQENLSYYYLNRYFSYSDAVILFLLLTKIKPSRIIELGSGFSTACMIDTIKHSNLKTHIESYDIEITRLKDLISGDIENIECITCHQTDIRNIDIDTLRSLIVNDILFIDSSHVSKYNSDLNFIVFKILPELRSGVIIHFHDVFKDFEYPKAWIDEGIYWNEQYLIRAFLQSNQAYEILLLSDHMEKEYTSWYESNLSLCLKPHERYSKGPLKGKWIQDLRGQSLWLRKK